MAQRPQQLLLDLEHHPAFAAEDFLPAPCNQAALAWLARYPDWPAPALILYGPEACGKSHLARIWAQRMGAVRLDPAALPGPGESGAWRVGVLDPAEPVADERALLRLYNLAKEEGRHLLLVARRPPSAWALALPDLRSRLKAAPAVEIGPPDDALLGALLVKLFADRQLRVGEGVIAWLIRHMERSFAAAHRMVAKLDALSLRQGRPVTVALARRALREIEQERG